MADLEDIIKEQIVAALLDERVKKAYGPYVAELLKKAEAPGVRTAGTAEMAEVLQKKYPAVKMSRQHLIVLAKRHPELRALAAPRVVPDGEKMPPLTWPVDETLAWFERNRT